MIRFSDLAEFKPRNVKKESPIMLRIFNAIQLTSLFAAGPLVIDYLADATFRGAGPAFYIACVAYGLGFIVSCCIVYDDLKG